MTPRRFAWLLAARGPDLSAWAERDRADAILLLRGDTGVQALLADALVADEAPVPDGAGLRRMRARVGRAVAPATRVARGVRLAAMATCVAAGLYAGFRSTEAEPPITLAASMDGDGSATVLAALDP